MAGWAMFAVATGAQVLAGLESSRMQAAQLREQAKISSLQGKAAILQTKLQADISRKAGEEEAMFIRRSSDRQVGSLIAGTAARGIDLSGSPALAIADQITQDERAASNAILNGTLRAQQAETAGFSAKAQGDAEASRLRTAAGFSETAGWIGAFSTSVRAYTYYDLATR